MVRARRKKSGVVMMDLITAMAVVFIGLCGVFTLLCRELRDIKDLYYRDIALMTAESAVETLRSLSLSELKECNNGPLPGDPMMLDNLKEGKGSLHIRNYPGSDGRIKEVTVNIGWEPTRGGRREIGVTTLIWGRSPGRQ